MGIEARHICATDAELLQEAFTGTPWDRGLQFFQQLVLQHDEDSRRVWVGLSRGRPVAFGSLVRESDYPPFSEARIPEIQDLNVAPEFRRKGVASCILDEAERVAFQSSEFVGIGFGLHAGYGAAQRLYVLRGYVPDANGVFCADRFPQEGEHVALDDQLVLYLLKRGPTRHAT